MASIKDVGKFFLFIVGGIVAIIVGSFMIRGTMHMWDEQDETNPNNREPSRKDKD
ncbi:hypothetical protein [Nitrosopumilus sp.]|uniref:hypothetical protein n=1 Tax=Nitrosopumilus sp. TaxID=2024843 RepID=UPI002931304A|nr:hypothetical protein [Nitrosopumilus sp.]